jgi:hypothetical protein
MTEKSHVSMERHVCLVCGAEYDTGAILLDRRLRASLEKYTITGWGLCSEDKRLFDDGFVALVECDPEKSGNPAPGDRLMPDRAYRTGRGLHIKRSVLAQICNVQIDVTLPFVFVGKGTVEMFEAMIGR